MQIEAQVDEADIGQVTRDNAVSFTVDAYPDVTFKGEVEQIRLAPVALNNVVTYTVVIDADNPSRPALARHDGQCRDRHRRAEERGGGAERRLALSAARAGASGACARRLGDRLDAGTGRRPRRAAAGKAEDPARADAKRRWARSAPRSRPSSPPSAVPGRPGRRRCRRMCASRCACASPRCSAPCCRPSKYKKYEEMARQRPSGPRRVTHVDLRGRRLLAARGAGSASPIGNTTEIVEGLPEGADVVVRATEGAQ